MTEAVLVTMALSLVATLFGLLVLVLGWIGNKTYGKLDEISTNLVKMAGELHTRINCLDTRLAKVETRLERRVP